ncbi:MAG: alpha/beta fold hydrolase [Phenylobacterium sp.]|jgi:pimeloyl-ACP methyl ester carboxylesterase
MSSTVPGFTFRRLRFDLPAVGGYGTAIEMGPQDRPVDIVFSHANGFNALTYRSILGPLSDRLRIVAVDQRGHGLSGLPPRLENPARNWYDLVPDLKAVLEVLEIRDAVLGGHSMGGTISLMAAAESPGRVRGIALFDPVIMAPGFAAENGNRPLTGDNPLLQGALRRRPVFPGKAEVIASYSGKGAFRAWTPDMLADYVEDGFHDTSSGEVELNCNPAWEASNFASHGHDPWPSFDAADVPIHILKAETGSTCRSDGHEAALTASGRIRLEVIPGTTHFVPMERPDLVRQTLTDLL